MDPNRRHEIFELQVLADLHQARLLEKLVFGGGTMLRLCHDLPRYSGDMDFYLRPAVIVTALRESLQTVLEGKYSLTDTSDKIHTLLYELRGKGFPRKLKLEIHKDRTMRRTQRSIAWSPFAALQVPVRTVPLDLMMRFKLEALCERREIRDACDMEFLLRRGVKLQATREHLENVLLVLRSFRRVDFQVILGSILPADERAYYLENGFSFLEGHLLQQLSYPD